MLSAEAHLATPLDKTLCGHLHFSIDIARRGRICHIDESESAGVQFLELRTIEDLTGDRNEFGSHHCAPHQRASGQQLTRHRVAAMSTNTTAEDAAKVPERSAVKTFFESVESRTSNPVHLRLLKAAAKEDPSAALERELGRIVQEILDEA